MSEIKDWGTVERQCRGKLKIQVEVKTGVRRYVDPRIYFVLN